MKKIFLLLSITLFSFLHSFAQFKYLKQAKEAINDKKYEVAIEKIEKYQEFIANAGVKLKEIQDKDKEIQDAMLIWNNQIAEHKTEERICTEKIHLFEKGKCPTCESDLTTDVHKSMLEDFLRRNDEAKSLSAEIKEKAAALHERQSSIKRMYDEVRGKKTTAETHIGSWRNELTRLNDGLVDNSQTDSLQHIIEDAKGKKTGAIVKKSEEEKKGSFLRIVEDVFGDKGVKLSALKRIVPLLNAEIRKVMTDLNMDYRVTFNEEFDVDIQHLGFKVSPEQLSTGERKKVDFATLVALIRLMKIRFAGLNLTFLDEIFSSIDSDGIYHILKVLHKTCRELNLNIFVINHSQLPTEIFDYKLEIQKNNGFSNLTIEKIG